MQPMDGNLAAAKDVKARLDAPERGTLLNEEVGEGEERVGEGGSMGEGGTHSSLWSRNSSTMWTSTFNGVSTGHLDGTGHED